MVDNGDRHDGRGARKPGLLTRLRHDQRGNTLAIVAAALFPLAGLVGGGIDVSRMYLAKTRLQQACDAGALAGRKVMGGGTWNYNNYIARATAENFFDANFKEGSYGTGTLTRVFTEDAGAVTGTASVVVPMTLMKVFKKDSETMTVVCDAVMRLPNTDVMFVLDTTGSMDSTLAGDSQKKIAALRTAVKCFFETVARLDTNAACTAGAPTGGLGDDVQVRFGFVPYATNVNVGKLLPTNWFADSWTYQSRRVVQVYGRPVSYVDGSMGNQGNATTVATHTGLANEAACQTQKALWVDGVEANGAYGAPANETTAGWTATQAWRQNTYSYTWTGNPRVCRVQVRRRAFTRTFTFDRVADEAADTVTFNAWRYEPVTMDISGLKNGTQWNNGVSLPIANNFGNTTVTWNGCIEERQTVRRSSYSPIPSDAIDLDIDRMPDITRPETQWGPSLFNALYVRRSGYANTGGDLNINPITTFTNYSGDKVNDCPAEARKLQEWPTAASFTSYVDTLTPNGNTYHDIGLLWGARFLSPNGMFRSENEFTPGGGEIERHLIFMTDGETCTYTMNYQAYGLAWFDRRQTDPNTVPSDGCETASATGGTLSQQVNARYTALCTAVKNKNITLWVIWFGANFPTAEARLTTCATPSRFFAARNSAQLQTTFNTIANQISQLRLTR